MKLSIIIPVYNVEHYLKECLDSILCNNLTGCELVLVVGDSTDKSNFICEEYRQHFPIIRIIRQTGKGLSNARNCGYEVCWGEYILFVDSDDYVKQQEFNELLSWLQKDMDVDMYITDFQMVTVGVNGKIWEKPVFQIGKNTVFHEGIDFLPQMLKRRQCFWNVWRCVYRKDFLKISGLKFLENTLSEDIDFTTRVLMSMPRTVFLHCPYYCYRVERENSLMWKTTRKRVEDTVKVISDSVLRLTNSDFPWRNELIRQYQFEWLLNLAQIYELPRGERNQVKTIFHKSQNVLKPGADRINHSIMLMLHVVGIGIPARLLYILKMVKRSIRKMKIGKGSKAYDNYAHTISHKLCGRR